MQFPQSYTTSTVKRERLEARVSSELKERLEYAAKLRGSSLSEFIIRSAEEVANTLIHEHKILTLSAKDSQTFAEMLINPPKPNKKLKSAYGKYKKRAISL